MTIDEPATFDDRIGRPAEGMLRLIADPSGGVWPGVDPNGRVVVAIGPEGGFTDEELEFAGARGWRTVSLGPTILRVETAALAAAARVLGTTWGNPVGEGGDG
jgi:16S rRNA (uracil1498-N3)-methyltransferase